MLSAKMERELLTIKLWPFFDVNTHSTPLDIIMSRFKDKGMIAIKGEKFPIGNFPDLLETNYIGFAAQKLEVIDKGT